MNANSIVRECIKHVGGKWKSDRDGGFWEIASSGFVAQAEPFIRGASTSKMWLGFECSVSHKSFAKIANYIMDDKPSSFVSLRWFQKVFELTNGSDERAVFYQMMCEILEEVRTFNIAPLVSEFSGLGPDGPSIPQVCHLAALAWNGDAHTLDGYLREFEAGRRMNFAPMINQEYICRAIEIARMRREREADG